MHGHPKFPAIYLDLGALRCLHVSPVRRTQKSEHWWMPMIRCARNFDILLTECSPSTIVWVSDCLSLGFNWNSQVTAKGFCLHLISKWLIYAKSLCLYFWIWAPDGPFGYTDVQFIFWTRPRIRACQDTTADKSNRIKRCYDPTFGPPPRGDGNIRPLVATREATPAAQILLLDRSRKVILGFNFRASAK